MTGRVTLVCFCGSEYSARFADISRGWAKTCSKRCAAVKRERGRPCARHLCGSAVQWGQKRLRNTLKVKASAKVFNHEKWLEEFDSLDDCDPSWDSHKDSF